nr:MAG TPA: endonuclease [Caudoviricetes sp.]
MKKVCKIRIYPNHSQITTIQETLGCCRYIKNLYIDYNQKRYKESGEFISGYAFSKIINKLKKTSNQFEWISNYSSKAIKDAIMEEEKAFKKFFKKTGGYPKFKSRKRINKESFFFIKDNIKYTENKRVLKLPILGSIRITEYGYLPSLRSISSGRIIREYNRYYVMFIYDYNPKGIDPSSIELGLKQYGVVVTNYGNTYKIPHFKNTKKYKTISDKIIRLQQVISHKVEITYAKKLHVYLSTHGEEPNEITKNIMKGESYHASRIRCLQRKVRRLKQTLANIRKDFIYKLVHLLTVRTKPTQITIENLDISDMIKHNGTKDTTLHRYIGESGFYLFRVQLMNKLTECKNIVLRIADQYFASSKICSNCGHKKKNLKLSDRVFVCNYCGFTIDRDQNAAINLLNLTNKDCLVYMFA